MEIIHIVLGKANPNRMNGVNKVVYQLATRQARAGREVSVWGISDRIVNYPEREFKTVLFKKGKTPFSVDPHLLTQLKRLKGRVTVHFHGAWISRFVPIARFLKRNNVPYVITPHGGYNTLAMRRGYWRKRLYYYLFEHSLLSGARVIHCLGESELIGLKSLSDSYPAVCIPYGFDMDPGMHARGDIRKALTFCFVGRIDVFTKGLDLIVSAFARLKSVNAKARLWIIGDGVERAQLENTVRDLGLSEYVDFPGAMYGKEKLHQMLQADVFLHPSRNEGLPSAVLEAASLGIPVIASHATNTGTYIESADAGWVVNNNDEDSLFNAMWQATQLPESVRKRASNARGMIKRYFNWEQLIPQYDQLYVG